MEPKLPTPHMSPEQAPRFSVSSGETLGQYHQGVESGNVETGVSVEAAREQLSNVTDAGGGAVPTLIQQQPIPAVHQALGVQQATPPATPLVAADEDLIEKEWVDRAKQIVAATRDDPFSQEREVSKLQADYLQKRYGKQVKISQ